MRIRTMIAAAAMTATALPAQAQCWQQTEQSAARVREMQTMLMVAALRCRAAGMDISADYDGFVGSQRDALRDANLVIKQHFAAGGGTQADYDRFTTGLANAFGADATGAQDCSDAAALAHDAAGAPASALDRLAQEALFPMPLPGGACAMDGRPAPASAAPDRGDRAIDGEQLVSPRPIPVVAVAAPVDPVTLPADLNAALAVLARFRAQPPATPDGEGDPQLAALAH